MGHNLESSQTTEITDVLNTSPAYRTIFMSQHLFPTMNHFNQPQTFSCDFHDLYTTIEDPINDLNNQLY